MFHQKLPFPALLSAEHYLLSLPLKWLVLHCLCFALAEHKLLTSSIATVSEVPSAALGSWDEANQLHLIHEAHQGNPVQMREGITLFLQEPVGTC